MAELEKLRDGDVGGNEVMGVLLHALSEALGDDLAHASGRNVLQVELAVFLTTKISSRERRDVRGIDTQETTHVIFPSHPNPSIWALRIPSQAM